MYNCPFDCILFFSISFCFWLWVPNINRTLAKGCNSLRDLYLYPFLVLLRFYRFVCSGWVGCLFFVFFRLDQSANVEELVCRNDFFLTRGGSVWFGLLMVLDKHYTLGQVVGLIKLNDFARSLEDTDTIWCGSINVFVAGQRWLDYLLEGLLFGLVL